MLLPNKAVNVTCSVPLSTYLRLMDIAENEGRRSLSSVLRRIISDSVDKDAINDNDKEPIHE